MTVEKYLGFNNVQELADDTTALFAECIGVPNSLLPEKYHCKRGEQSLASIQKKYARLDKKSAERAAHRAERARRTALYAARLESGEIQYEAFVIDGLSAGRPKKLF